MNSTNTLMYREFEKQTRIKHEEGKGLAIVQAHQNANTKVLDDMTALATHTRLLYHFYNGAALALNRLVNLQHKTELSQINLIGNTEELKNGEQSELKLKTDMQVKQRQSSFEPFPFMAIGKFILSALINVFLVLADWFFTARSLQVAQHSMGTSLLLGFGITLGMLVITHLSDRWIESMQIARRKMMARLVIAAIYLAIIVGILIIRIEYDSQIGVAHNGSSIITAAVLIISALALYLNTRFLLTPAYRDLKQVTPALKRMLSIIKIGRKLKAQRANRSDIKTNVRTEFTALLTDANFFNHMEKEINAQYNEAIDFYRMEYLRVTATGIADSFIPPLQFESATITINTP